MRRTRLVTLSALLAFAIIPCVWGQGPQASPAGKDVYGDPLPEGAIARLGTIRWRHSTTVIFAAFLEGGKSVLSVADDRTIRVWEYPSGKELRQIEKPQAGQPGPRRFVQRHSICLSPDGN